MDIEYNAKPDKSIEKLAEAQHEQYEEEHGVFFGFTPFQLVARENGEIAGVLSGYAVYREIDFIHLVTNGFQAPGFYEKCGYTLEFVRRSPHDPKYDKYYFSKNISSRRESKKF